MDDSQLEELREENHRLNLRLEHLKQTSTSELDYLKDELALKDREQKEQVERLCLDAKNREIELQEQISTLNEDLIGSREEVDKLKEQNEAIKINLEQLKARNNDSYHRRANVSFTMDHYEALKYSLEEKEKALTRANETITSQSERLREYNEIIDAQRSRVVGLSEELELKQNTIFEVQDRMRQLEMERNEQIHQQQQQVLDKCDTSKDSRGNSLFSEVEERRIRVEDELKRLRDRVTKLTQENLDLQATVESGDRRHTAVSNQLQILNRSEQQMIQEIKKFKTEGLNLFDSYRTRMESLRSEYIQRLNQYRGNGVPESEIEKLTSERDQLILTKMSLDRELFECKKDLKYTKHMKTECEAHLKILRIKLQDTNDKRGSPKRSSTESTHNFNGKNDSVEEAQPRDDVMIPEKHNSIQKDSQKTQEIPDCQQQ